jgi:hypothetical protein
MEASMRLRYRVFAGEQGARVQGAHKGLHTDGYDAFCHHLLVRDTRSDYLIGCASIAMTDVFIRLDMDRVPSRYHRHFMDRALPTEGRRVHEMAEGRVQAGADRYPHRHRLRSRRGDGTPAR